MDKHLSCFLMTPTPSPSLGFLWRPSQFRAAAPKKRTNGCRLNFRLIRPCRHPWIRHLVSTFTTSARTLPISDIIGYRVSTEIPFSCSSASRSVPAAAAGDVAAPAGDRVNLLQNYMHSINLCLIALLCLLLLFYISHKEWVEQQPESSSSVSST